MAAPTENASMLLRYRFALAFGAAWLLFALFCLLTTFTGGHPPAGILLWLIAYSHTLTGRLVFEIYGTESVMSSFLMNLVLGLIELPLIGGAIGLILERTLGRIASGTSLLVAYVAAHMLVAPLAESRAVLLLRLQSSDPGAFRTLLDRIRRDTVDVDLLVEELPRIADHPDPRDNLAPWRASQALDTLTELKGIEFWRSYLRSEQGQTSSARFCENVLASAERTAPPHCKELGGEVWLKQLNELTGEVARCYVREIRAGRPEGYKLVVLARYFPWVIDENRDLLLEELTSGDPNWGFGVPSDPRNPCYVHDNKKMLLVSGGIYLRGKSREELQGVLDYWRACPYVREQRVSLRPSGCR